MTRIGKQKIYYKTTTSINYSDNILNVETGYGKRSYKLPSFLVCEDHKEYIMIVPVKEKVSKSENVMYGTTVSHIKNLIQGLEEKFIVTLVIHGLGYRCIVESPKKLKFLLGFSHPIFVDIPEGIEIEVLKQTKIITKSIDKNLVTKFCAYIRLLKKPEPYLGKGIRYENEKILRKEGKKATK